jgi:hypothetical protein
MAHAARMDRRTTSSARTICTLLIALLLVAAGTVDRSRAEPLYTVTDTTFAKDGKIALWTKADSITRFDRVDIRPLR